jgi:chorismate--pyruvate lyase
MLSFPIMTIGGEAHWQAAAAWAHLLSPQQQHWLLDDSSLTAKLKAHCQQFRVHLLGQQQATMLADEARWIGDHEVVTAREVILHCDDTAWVFARSVFAEQALQTAQLNLAQLGNRPLGEHLFSQPDLQRSAIEISAFPAHSRVGQLHQQLGFPAQTLWGRRSCFSVAGQRILVAEVFIGAAPLYHPEAME